MSNDYFSQDEDRPPMPNVARDCPSLPPWLARRILRADEEVAWVRGPRRNPWWEPLVTNPLLFVAALGFGAFCLAVGWLTSGSWKAMSWPGPLAAFVIVIGSIYILAIGNSYFTRLVVTNFRLVILQGREICRTWNIDDLPPSLIRYGRGGSKGKRSVDLDALQAMLANASENVAEAKTIRAFGKQLDQVKARDISRP